MTYVKPLSEVVVTVTVATNSKKKLDISVQAITADKLPPVPKVSIAQALVGKVAGTQIGSVHGTPGDRVNILLHVINSLCVGT